MSLQQVIGYLPYINVLLFLIACVFVVAVFPTHYIVKRIAYSMQDDPLNVDNPSFTYTQMLTLESPFRRRFWKGLFSYRLLLLIPFVMFVSGVFVAITAAACNVSNKKQISAESIGLPLILLSLTIPILLLVQAIVKTDTKLIRQTNTYIRTYMSDDLAFTNALAIKKGDRVYQIKTYQTAFDKLQIPVEAKDANMRIARALFTANMYLNMHEMGARNPKLEDAVRLIAAESKVTSGMLPNYAGYLSPKTANIVNYVPEIITNTSIHEKFDTSVITSAQALVVEWISNVNGTLSQITYSGTTLAVIIATVGLIAIYMSAYKIMNTIAERLKVNKTPGK